MINLRKYQKWTSTTAVYPDAKTGNSLERLYLAVGLANEAGEVGGKIKKIYRDHNGTLTPQMREQILSEMSDVMWYLARLAYVLGIDLEDIFLMSIDKLEKRRSVGTLKGSGDKR